MVKDVNIRTKQIQKVFLNGTKRLKAMQKQQIRTLAREVKTDEGKINNCGHHVQ